MKRPIFLAVLAVVMLNVNAQEKKEIKKAVTVPVVVKTAFATQFPKATAAWSLEKKGEYEAEFKEGKTSTSVLFDAKGSLIETESIIQLSELPEAVKTAFANNYKGSTIVSVEKNTLRGVLTYELTVKGKKKCTLIFDPSGKFLKQE